MEVFQDFILLNKNVVIKEYFIKPKNTKLFFNLTAKKKIYDKKIIYY